MMAYTAGALEPSVQIEFERHMAGCEGCRKIAAEQRAVWDALDAWKPVTISADFNDKLYKRISEEAAVAWWQRPLRFNWSWGLRPALPVAAACAAIMVAFLVKEPLPAHRSPVPAEHKVSIEQVERALDDMDMLKQMSLTAPAEGHSTERI
jgi:anti-sigma factor RsiW